jgi:hypothetical protein
VILLPAKLNAKAIKLMQGKNFTFLGSVMPDVHRTSHLSGSTVKATQYSSNAIS